MGEHTEKNSFPQSTDNLISILNEFLVFLKITIDDLKAKRQTLKLQHRILVEDRMAKMYLSCQIVMLKKHIHRLECFDTQIDVMLNLQHNKGIPNDGEMSHISSLVRNFSSSKIYQVPEINTKGNLTGKDNEHTTLSLDYIKQCSPDCDVNLTNNDISSPLNAYVQLNTENSLDPIFNNLEYKELSKWFKDVRTMKKYCKHILDITDKYCVISNEKDLKLNVLEDEIASNFNSNLSKSPGTSRWTVRSSRCNSLADSILLSNKTEVNSFKLLQLPASIGKDGWTKMTFMSCWDHMSFLIKTHVHKPL